MLEKTVVVIGSINMDIVNHVENHPVPGETIKGFGTEYSPGGKGANQAVAASLAGVNVIMIGAVGDDPFGQVLRTSLADKGVQTQCIQSKPGSSGLAFITVNNKGQNHIILSEGANGQLTVADITASLAELGEINVILFQNEIPWETTEFAMRWAHSKGIKVYYNPAPAMKVSVNILPYIDLVILNESEIQCITELPVSDAAEAEKAADVLIGLGAKAVIVTLGEKGSLYKDNERNVITPAFRVTPQDTTAAGDTFIGAFAAAQTDGIDIVNRLRFASAAAALSVSRKGAQDSIPTKEEIEQFIASN
jgi:ribokinase